MLTLHDMSVSGNAYKARLLMTLLGIPFARIEYGAHGKSTSDPALAALSPMRKVPVLEVAPGIGLAESNAILFYLAEGTRFLPEDRLARAQVMQWMFFEQYYHEPYIGTARHWISHLGRKPESDPDLADKIVRGNTALAVMERHLAKRRYFVDERYTIADIALYGYTHVADEGSFDLAAYPAIGAWLARIAAEPGHVPITA